MVTIDNPTTNFVVLSSSYGVGPGTWHLPDGVYLGVPVTNLVATVGLSGGLQVVDIQPPPGSFVSAGLSGFASGLLVVGGLLMLRYLVGTFFGLAGVRNVAD